MSEVIEPTHNTTGSNGEHTAEDLAQMAARHVSKINLTTARAVPAGETIPEEASGAIKVDGVTASSQAEKNSGQAKPGETFKPQKPADKITDESGHPNERKNAKEDGSYNIGERTFKVGDVVEYTSETGKTKKYTVEKRSSTTPEDEIVLKSIDNENLVFATDNVEKIKQSQPETPPPPEERPPSDVRVSSEPKNTAADVEWGTPPHDPNGPYSSAQNPEKTVYPDVDWRGSSSEEKPPVEPPEPPPPPEEPPIDVTDGKFQFKVADVDSKELARSQVERGLQLEMEEKNAEILEKSRGKGRISKAIANLRVNFNSFKAAYRALWSHGQGREAVTGHRIRRTIDAIRAGYDEEFRRQILARMQSAAEFDMAGEGADYALSGVRMAEGEDRDALENDFKNLLKSCVDPNAERDLTLDEFRARAQELLFESEHGQKLIPKSHREDILANIDDLGLYLEHLRGITDHNEAIAVIDSNFELLLADVRAGERSEVRHGFLEKLLKFGEDHPIIGTVVNETTIGVAVFIGAKMLPKALAAATGVAAAATIGTAGLAAAIPIAASLAVAGGIAAARNRYHLRKDRMMAARDREIGLEGGERLAQGEVITRREKVDATTYQTVSMAGIGEILSGIPRIEADGERDEIISSMTQEQAAGYVAFLSDMEARLQIQDRTGQGMFSWLTYEEATGLDYMGQVKLMEQRRNLAIIAREQIRDILEEIASERPELLSGSPDASVDIDRLISDGARLRTEAISPEITEKDRVFGKLESRRGWQSFFTTAGIGLALGTGLKVALDALDVHPFGWLTGEKAGPAQKAALSDQIPVGQDKTVQVGQGLAFQPSKTTAGEFALVDSRSGDVLADNLKLGQNGVLDQAGVDSLNQVKVGDSFVSVRNNHLEAIPGPDQYVPAGSSDQALESLRGTGELRGFARHFPGDELDHYQLDLQPPRPDGSIEVTFSPKSAAAIEDVQAGRGAVLLTFKNAGLPADAPGAREGLIVSLDTNGKAILTPDQFKGINITQTVGRPGPDLYGAMPREGFIEAVGLHGQLPDGRFDLTSYATQRPTGDGDYMIPVPTTRQVGNVIIDLNIPAAPPANPLIPIAWNPDQTMHKPYNRQTEQGATIIETPPETPTVPTEGPPTTEAPDDVVPWTWAGSGEGATQIGRLFGQGLGVDSRARSVFEAFRPLDLRNNKTARQCLEVNERSFLSEPASFMTPEGAPLMFILLNHPDPEHRHRIAEKYQEELAKQRESSSAAQAVMANPTTQSTNQTPADNEQENEKNPVLSDEKKDALLERAGQAQLVGELLRVISRTSGVPTAAVKDFNAQKRLIKSFERGLAKEEIWQTTASNLTNKIQACIANQQRRQQEGGTFTYPPVEEIALLQELETQVKYLAGQYPDRRVERQHKKEINSNTANQVKDFLEEFRQEQHGQVKTSPYLGELLDRTNGMLQRWPDWVDMGETASELLSDIPKYKAKITVSVKDEKERARQLELIDDIRSDLEKWADVQNGAMTQEQLLEEAIDAMDRLKELGAVDVLVDTLGEKGYYNGRHRRLKGHGIYDSVRGKLTHLRGYAKAGRLGEAVDKKQKGEALYYVYSVLDTFYRLGSNLTLTEPASEEKQLELKRLIERFEGLKTAAWRFAG